MAATVTVAEVVQRHGEGVRDFSSLQIEERASFGGKNLTGANFRHTYLVGADFRNAILRDVSFTEAVLTCANFTGADLTGADFIDAIVVDAVFAEGDTSASGLLTRQFAGALLSGARLPEAISKFDTLSTVAESAKIVGTLFLTTIAACVYSLITVATTTDAGLLTNSATSTLPVVSASFPIVGFYYVAPALLFSLYAYLHLHMQRLFDSIASLPACFPDGNYAHQKVYPTLLNVFAPLFFVRLRNARPPLFWFQVVMVRFLFWGAVPFTLLLIWARYLRRHAWFGSLFHIMLFAAVLLLGFLFQRIAFATFLHDPAARRRWPRYSVASFFLGVILVGAMLFAYREVIWGGRPAWLTASYGAVPIAGARTPWLEIARRMAGRLFIADLVDVAFPPSTRGDGRGPDMSNLNLRFVRAWRASMPGALFVNADLTGAELANADLSRAQLIGTNLVGADLKETKLTGAAIAGADFSGADLSGADLAAIEGGMAHFDRARLAAETMERFQCSGCSFRNAVVSQEFDKAVLLSPDFQNAILTDAYFTGGFVHRGNFSGAQAESFTATGTFMGSCDFSGARMDGAVFEKGVNLKGAKFRGTNLHVAEFGDAFVAEADFTNADLTAANLANVRGLTVAQIASARTDDLTQLPRHVQEGIAAARRRVPSAKTSSRVRSETTTKPSSSKSKK